MNKYDTVYLYRGGREDEAMFVYSVTMVLDAVVNSNIPIANGEHQ